MEDALNTVNPVIIRQVAAELINEGHTTESNILLRAAEAHETLARQREGTSQPNPSPAPPPAPTGGLRALSNSEVTPDIRAHAERILREGHAVGTDVPFTSGGQQFVGRVQNLGGTRKGVAVLKRV